MIIGDGDIASALKEIDRKDRIFFVSGVSNSSETRESEFQREKNLLFNLKDEKHIVYVSSLAIFYSDTPYARHKRTMEQCIKTFAFTRRIPQNWTIIRVGNISWGTNPHTIINYLRARATKGEPLDIQDTERYLVDKDEFLYWVGMVPSWPCEMNITGTRMTVAEIVQEYVEPHCRLEAVA